MHQNIYMNILRTLSNIIVGCWLYQEVLFFECLSFEAQLCPLNIWSMSCQLQLAKVKKSAITEMYNLVNLYEHIFRSRDDVVVGVVGVSYILNFLWFVCFDLFFKPWPQPQNISNTYCIVGPDTSENHAPNYQPQTEKRWHIRSFTVVNGQS